MTNGPAFERLAATLFDGEVKAADVKATPGTGAGQSRDELAQALLDSMERSGITVGGALRRMAVGEREA